MSSSFRYLDPFPSPISRVSTFRHDNQAAVKGPVRDTLLSAGLVDLIGKENFYWDVHDAVVLGQQMLEVTLSLTKVCRGLSCAPSYHCT